MSRHGYEKSIVDMKPLSILCPKCNERRKMIHSITPRQRQQSGVDKLIFDCCGARIEVKK